MKPWIRLFRHREQLQVRKPASDGTRLHKLLVAREHGSLSFPSWMTCSAVWDDSRPVCLAYTDLELGCLRPCSNLVGRLLYLSSGTRLPMIPSPIMLKHMVSPLIMMSLMVVKYPHFLTV
jgi:hypothetical protein